MQKYRNLILTLIETILIIFVWWYDQQLVNTIFIFALIPRFGVLIMYIFCLGSTIVDLKKSFLIPNLISLILLIIPIVIILLPIKNLKTYLTFNNYEKSRLEVIEMVNAGVIVPDEYKNAKLPKKYKYLSSDGKIHIYQNNESGQQISFWVIRGFLSGSEELMYSSGGEEMIYKNRTGHPIKSINKIKDNWYYVITDY